MHEKITKTDCEYNVLLTFMQRVNNILLPLSVFYNEDYLKNLITSFNDSLKKLSYDVLEVQNNLRNLSTELLSSNVHNCKKIMPIIHLMDHLTKHVNHIHYMILTNYYLHDAIKDRGLNTSTNGGMHFSTNYLTSHFRNHLNSIHDSFHKMINELDMKDHFPKLFSEV